MNSQETADHMWKLLKIWDYFIIVGVFFATFSSNTLPMRLVWLESNLQSIHTDFEGIRGVAFGHAI
jgi:hypothetical protein